MRTASCKAKGRRLAQLVKQRLVEVLGIPPADIFVTSSSVTGEDIGLSPLARATFPFTVECKNQEKLNVWEALKQAEGHTLKSPYTPLVIFSRNHSKTYAVVEFDALLKLVKDAHG
jgi:hypothetical protein